MLQEDTILAPLFLITLFSFGLGLVAMSDKDDAILGGFGLGVFSVGVVLFIMILVIIGFNNVRFV